MLGGGVAGLAAAGCLAEAGRKVTLLEARARLGGRVHTVLDPALKHPVELGAEFVQGESSEFLRTIDALGLELDELPEVHERARQRPDRSLADIEALVDRLLELRTPDRQDVPVSLLIQQRAKQHFTPDERETLTAYLQSFHGADLDRFGTAALAENQAAQRMDGDRALRVVGGYGALVSRLAERLQVSHATVHTDTIVKRIRWQPGAVQVEARTGSGGSVEFTAAQAILTLPLSALKAEWLLPAHCWILSRPAGARRWESGRWGWHTGSPFGSRRPGGSSPESRCRALCTAGMSRFRSGGLRHPRSCPFSPAGPADLGPSRSPAEVSQS